MSLIVQIGAFMSNIEKIRFGGNVFYLAAKRVNIGEVEGSIIFQKDGFF